MAEAAELYRVVVEKTDQMAVRMQYALALEQSGRDAEAIEQYLAVWNTHKNAAAANNAAYRMQVLYADDPAKLAEAHQLASEAVRLQPDQGAFRDTLGWIGYLRGHYEAAARELAQAVRKAPSSPAVHYHVGVAEAAAGNRQLAMWHLANASKLAEQLTAAGRDVGADGRQAAALAGEMLARMNAAQ